MRTRREVLYGLGDHWSLGICRSRKRRFRKFHGHRTHRGQLPAPARRLRLPRPYLRSCPLSLCRQARLYAAAGFDRGTARFAQDAAHGPGGHRAAERLWRRQFLHARCRPQDRRQRAWRRRHRQGHIANRRSPTWLPRAFAVFGSISIRRRPEQLDADSSKRTLDLAVEKIQGRGWHIQFYTRPPVIAALKSHIEQLPFPVVFDHFGGAKAAEGPDQPGFDALLDLVKSGRAYVKISAALPHLRQGA